MGKAKVVLGFYAIEFEIEKGAELNLDGRSLAFINSRLENLSGITIKLCTSFRRVATPCSSVTMSWFWPIEFPWWKVYIPSDSGLSQPSPNGRSPHTYKPQRVADLSDGFGLIVDKSGEVRLFPLTQVRCAPTLKAVSVPSFCLERLHASRQLTFAVHLPIVEYPDPSHVDQN